MSGAKEVGNKIKSIKSTQKITKAMEMVAASKMRKSQQIMLATRPYAEKIQNVVAHLAEGESEYSHPFLEAREVKRVGYIIVATDRGLCGSLNAVLFRQLIERVEAHQAKGETVVTAALGVKAQAFASRTGLKLMAAKTHLGDAPQLDDLRGTINVMQRAYLEGEIDELYLAHSQFVNTMSQKPNFINLLPIALCKPSTGSEQEKQHSWDYLYEPDAESLIEKLLERFIESQVYQGVVENGACEQAARMVAMKSASDNAHDLINELQLIYNKARQAAITQEISEIVSGAAAV